MILQALCGYYDRLIESGDDTPVFGFSVANVAAYITINPAGEITAVSSLLKNKKPVKKQVPQQVKRTVGVDANFLCDNDTYIFGIDKRDKDGKLVGKKENGTKKFSDLKKLHHKILDNLDCPEAKAVLNFIDNATAAFEKISDDDKVILSEGNIVFRLEGNSKFIHENEEIKKVWINYTANAVLQDKVQCLITGEFASYARLHDGISGLAKDKLTIISFNQSSSESYGKKQGAGAPVSEDAAFKYAAALNALVADKRHRINIAGDKVIFWAERKADKEEEILGAFFANSQSKDDKKEPEDEATTEVDETTATEIKALLSTIKSGKVNTTAVVFDENVKFSLLGISGNSTRAVIRFFYQNTFGEILKKVLLHYADINIVKKDSDSDIISPWRILVNTAVAGKSDNIPPLLESALMRSILNGSAYPFNLYTAILNRAKAEAKIDFVRAGVLKGYLNRIARENHKPEKEMITMALNKDETNPGYLLGRLMAVLEKAQKDALGDVNSNVMDKYLNSAMSNPETVFPTLLKLFEKHLNKSEQYYTKKIVTEIFGKFSSDGFSQTLDFNDQGRFLIGYYHQNTELYTKKTTPEKEN